MLQELHEQGGNMKAAVNDKGIRMDTGMLWFPQKWRNNNHSQEMKQVET